MLLNGVVESSLFIVDEIWGKLLVLLELLRLVEGMIDDMGEVMVRLVMSE